MNNKKRFPIGTLVYIVIMAFGVSIIIIGIKGCFTMRSEDSEDGDDSEDCQSYRLLTHEECDKLEEDIADFLSGYDLYFNNYMNIKVSSGYEKDGTVIKKNKLYIILDGRLAETYEDAVTLSDGYMAAMELYFGASKIDDYDVEVRIAERYTFLNGALQSDSGSTTKSPIAMTEREGN